MDNLSTDVKVPHQIAIPLLQTSMVFEEVAGRQADSIIEYRGDSILLFFPADFSLRDTMEIPKTGQNLRFEHFYLYHGIQNMFPIGLDIDLVLRNDDLNVNLDTFSLKGKDADVDVPFIEPAPVGSNNLVDESAVHEKEGYLALDSTFFNQYYGDATHLIIVFTLQQTADTLRILDHYNMDIRNNFV